MFGEQTRCITGDVQMVNRVTSRLRSVAVIVDVKEKGVISKGTGGCPALSFATVVKTQSGIYNTTTSFLSSSSLHPCSKNKKQ